MNLNPFHQGWFVPRLVEIVTVVLETKDFKSQCFFLYHNYLFLKTSPKDALCQVWSKLAQWFLIRGFINIISFFWFIFKKMLFHFENGGILYWKDIRCGKCQKLENKQTGDQKISCTTCFQLR